jgi:hypothetical protein
VASGEEIMLDASGALLGNPVHYRDGRSRGNIERFP